MAGPRKCSILTQHITKSKVTILLKPNFNPGGLNDPSLTFNYSGDILNEMHRVFIIRNTNAGYHVRITLPANTMKTLGVKE